MKILEFMLNYLEENEVVFMNREEQCNVTRGMKAYLKENGIDEMEEREYFKDFVSKHLEIIETNDLKDYFLAYPILSNINQIIIEYRSGMEVNIERKKELLSNLSELQLRKIGNKYVPILEINAILGEDI